MSLKEFRKRSGLTQVEVAESLGVDSTMVSKWERGHNPISEQHIVRLSKLLNVPADDIREWVYGPEQTAKAPENWRMHIIEAGLEPYVMLALMVLSVFRDEKLGVASFSMDDLWKHAKIPVEARDATWKGVLESGFVRRVGTGEWTFELVYPY